MPSAEILSQGDEVVTGQTIDTNAAWLADRLTGLGFEVRGHSSVGDRLDHIQDLVATACARSDLVLCTGGLGPTEDDLTAEAVGAVAEQPLAFDPEAMAQIERLFRRFGKPMPESNRKQALLPHGSLRLDNRWGTAPGFALHLDQAWIACLPGVPREMRKLFDARVMPLIEQHFALTPRRLVTLRTAGIGESKLQQLIGPWRHPDVVLSYRTMPPENQIKLRFAPGTPDAEVERVAGQLADTIGAPVFAREGISGPDGDLASVCVDLLARRGLSLAIAEQGCGGRLLSMLHSARGAEGLLRCSMVDRVGTTLDATAVAALAERVRGQGDADLGLALALNADPDSGDPGRGELALSGPGYSAQRPFRVAGGRDLIRTLGAGAAMDFLRRQLITK